MFDAIDHLSPDRDRVYRPANYVVFTTIRQRGEFVENAKWRQAARDFLSASKLYASRSRGNGLNWTTWVSLLYMYTRQISTENRSRFKKTTEFSDAKEMASVQLRNLPEISIWWTPRCDAVRISDEILEQRSSSIFNPLPFVVPSFPTFFSKSKMSICLEMVLGIANDRAFSV